MCNNVITVSPACTHTRTIPAFTPQPQGVIALWLVLIYIHTADADEANEHYSHGYSHLIRQLLL